MNQRKKYRISARKLFLFLLIVSILLTSMIQPVWAASLPMEVRVGLFYSSGAQDYYHVKSDKGLRVGTMVNGVFNSLFEEPANNIVTVRKDIYLKNDENNFQEYGFAQTSSSFDYYHIQLGGNYNSLADAKNQTNTFQQSGIQAFPVFTDTWQVWTGFYSDAQSAQSDVERVKSKLGNQLGYKVVSPSQKRIAVLSNKYGGASDSYTTYKVQSGDSLSKIAIKFGMTVDELKSVNQLASDLIRSEQVLKVKSIGLKDTRVEFMFESGSGQLRVQPMSAPHLFELNSQSYRGEMEFKRVSGSDMTAINVLNVDEYLYGVVPSEVGSKTGTPFEAMKAQAVVSRTYILNSLGRHGSMGFDLCTTEHCQVYKGISAETPNTNSAVDATKGEVVMYNNQLAQVFYSSSNGGNTELVKNVWNPKVDLPYIKSFQDKYDPADSWEVTLTADQIRNLTKDKVGNILNVVVLKTSDSQRVVELKIQGERGEIPYSREECRTIFGLPSQLFSINGSSNPVNSPSLSFKLNGKSVMTKDGLKRINLLDEAIKVIKGDGIKLVSEVLKVAAPPANTNTTTTTSGVFKFSGKGRGHGIGMSQKGAISMAGTGATYRQILEYYFPGTEIK
ncbi:MAG: SpoIID/LytB domain-containing protein [Clostridia bacterium]|nr:SpoIID/LytB domain-containing protein [Clostridia bacterium]